MRRREDGTAQTKVTAASLQFEPLDKKSFTPLYFQIQSQLLKMINSGKLRAGDSLPGEEELGHVYGVSRMTSRQALQVLKQQGFASRQRGRGTFVTQPKVEKDITHLSGFTAEMHALGMKATSRVLVAEVIPAAAEVAAQLAVEVTSPIFRLRRLRLADGLPVAIEEGCLPLGLCPGIQKFDFSRVSLYTTLRERYAIRVSSASEILEARAATRQEAKLLEIKSRSSLLIISRTLWSVEGKPIETTRSSYRGDRYRAVLRIPATEVE
jgi:GntR family transcriptional regulator